MYTFLIVFHVIVSILLIIAVLLQQGRGGGLIESFSGAAESIFGTKTNVFMVRITTTCAVLFFVTTLSLAFLSTQRTKSLVGASQDSSQEETSQIPPEELGITEQAPASETQGSPAQPQELLEEQIPEEQSAVSLELEPEDIQKEEEPVTAPNSELPQD